MTSGLTHLACFTSVNLRAVCMEYEAKFTEVIQVR